MSWKKGNRLSLVQESAAQGRVREIFDDIKQTIGIPHVNVLFQAYAFYPSFLDIQWRTIKPVIETQIFFDLAERLRADAYTCMHNYFEIPDLSARASAMQFSSGAKQELAEVVELFQYNNPLLLLITAAQMQAFDGLVGDPDAPRKPAAHPEFHNRPILVQEEQAGPAIRKIYEELKRTVGMPVVNTDYRAFARWPDFLQTYWQVLKPTIESPLYERCQFGVREDAWSLVKELPGPIDLTVALLADAGIEDDDLASLVRITELFVRSLSGLVLNVALAKIGMEGGNLQQKKQPQPEKVRTGSPTRAA